MHTSVLRHLMQTPQFVRPTHRSLLQVAIIYFSPALLCYSNVCADVYCVRLSADNRETFSFATWTGEGTEYVDNIVEGEFTSNAYGMV